MKVRMTLMIEDATPEELELVLRPLNRKRNLELYLSKGQKDMLNTIDSLRERQGDQLPLEEVYKASNSERKYAKAAVTSLVKQGILFEPMPGFISRVP